MWAFPDQHVFHPYLQGVEVFSSFEPIFSHPRARTGIDLADDAQTKIPSLVLVPIHFPTTCFRIVFPTAIRQVGDQYRFRSRGTIGSTMSDFDLGHLCRVRLQDVWILFQGNFSMVLKRLPL